VRNIGAFATNPSWAFSEFSGIDLNTVLRIDIDWFGFTLPGADIEFAILGVKNSVPEPATLTMLLIGGLALRHARKRMRIEA